MIHPSSPRSECFTVGTPHAGRRENEVGRPGYGARVRLADILIAAALASGITACGAPAATDSAPSAGLTVADPSGVAPATAVSPDLMPMGESVSGLVVDRVVDGDTVKVLLDGELVSVRLIGMNTPETVKPGSPVECLGPEASDFAEDLLSGQRVTLEFDKSQGRTDRYDRVLAYVWRELPGGDLRLFNAEAIAGGYAFERQYGSRPYAWRDEFVKAQAAAESVDAGLWGACET